MKNVFLVSFLHALNVCCFAADNDDVDTYIAVNQHSNENIFVLIIGNEEYKDEQPVPYALNDARVFRLYF